MFSTQAPVPWKFASSLNKSFMYFDKISFELMVKDMVSNVLVGQSIICTNVFKLSSYSNLMMYNLSCLLVRLL